MLAASASAHFFFLASALAPGQFGGEPVESDGPLHDLSFELRDDDFPALAADREDGV